MAAGGGAQDTKIIYHVDDEETPYLVKIPKPSDQVTLGDFKNVIQRPNYKFFFKSMDDDFGVVKEELVDDDALLPCFNGRVVSWVVPPDEGSAGGSDRGDGQSHHSGEGMTPVPNFSSSRRRDKTGFESEAESVVSRRSSRSRSSRKYESDVERRSRHHRGDRSYRGGMDSSSVMSSDLETTSFVDSDEDSRLSSATENSRYSGRQRKKRTRRRMPRVERCSSFSTITESTMSLNIITVTLNMEKINFLGISIVGQANKRGDGGIYVGSVMKGGAVDADGRIEPGDMILSVGDVNFENMSNDDAVRVLREAVHKPGPITLTVAKCWDPSPQGYFSVPRNETIKPIDPAAWLQHSEAVRAAGGLMGRPGVMGSSSMSTMTSTTSSSLTNSIPEADRYLMDNPDLEFGLTIDTDMQTVVKVMSSPDSGLVVRDRMWLKITIPNAFIGSDLVDWLFGHVEGFQDRRDARKYASKMLKAGFIRHTVNKITFSEQCYYVFGDVTSAMKGLTLTDIEGGEEDSLAPLAPQHPQLGQWTGMVPPPNMMMPPQLQAALSQQYMSDNQSQPPAYSDMFGVNPTGGMFPYNPYFVQHPGAMMPNDPGTSQRKSGGTASQSSGSQRSGEQHLDFDQSTVRSSGSSERSAGSRDSKKKAAKEEKASIASFNLAAPQQPQMQPDTVSLHSQFSDHSLPRSTVSAKSAGSSGGDSNSGEKQQRELGAVPPALSASRQSFRMAMGNISNDFFVDVM